MQCELRLWSLSSSSSQQPSSSTGLQVEEAQHSRHAVVVPDLQTRRIGRVIMPWVAPHAARFAA